MLASMNESKENNMLLIKEYPTITQHDHKKYGFVPKKVKIRMFDSVEKKFYQFFIGDLISIRADGVFDMSLWFDGKYILTSSTTCFDKNGKEIYDGDITNYGICQWSGWYWAFYKEDWEGREFENCMDKELLPDVEIIGNVFENPT